jgi:hypothetical protein
VVYKHKNGHLYNFVDFGNIDYTGDCFSFVGWVFNKDTSGKEGFIDVMEIINRELGLGLSSNKDKIRELTHRFPNTLKTASELDPLTIKPNQEIVSVQFTPPEYKGFTAEEQMYWLSYGISLEVLKKYGVRSVKTFYGTSKSGETYTINSTEDEPIFAYPGNGYVKIYRPNSQSRFRYGGNLHEGYSFGIDQLSQRGDVLFITGGEKDVLSLAARGFNAICFNSETANIPKKIIRRFSFRFKHIVLLYDMDETGVKAMNSTREKLKEFNVKALALPLTGGKNQKDISDFFRTESNTLDLHDNKIHREYLRTFIESLRMSGAIDITENTTLSTCLQYARKMTTQFQFSAVRMKHLPLKRNSSNHVHERDVLRLEDGRQTLWFDFDPLVQVGVFDLPILDMESFKLVERYCSEDEFI